MVVQVQLVEVGGRITYGVEATLGNCLPEAADNARDLLISQDTCSISQDTRPK